MKGKLLGYGTDPFTLDYPITLLRGEKIDKTVDNDMGQVEILGKEKLNEFIQGRLINWQAGFLNTIKKNIPKTGIKLEKKSKIKIVSTLQEDCQALELNVDISLSLEKAFPYPLIPVTLSFTTPDGKLWQSGSREASFWNYIIKESEALHTFPPEDAAWFIDSMVLIKCLKPKNL